MQQTAIAILTGGESRRMGTDKALLRVDDGFLLERTLDLARELSDEVFLVGYRDAYEQFGVPIVADAFPGSGPLGGIATALRASSAERVLALGCDMPHLQKPLLEAMLMVECEADAIVPLTFSSGHAVAGYETLMAIYNKSCLPHFEDAIDVGRLRVRAALVGLQVLELHEGSLRQFDPQLQSFVNTNTPEEWRKSMKGRR